MDALTKVFSITWNWITANWKWTAALAVLSAIVGYLSYQLNRANRSGNYSKQLFEGHKIRKEAEKLLEQGDCINVLQNARDAYRAANAYARTKKEYAEASLFRAVCEYWVSRHLGEMNLTKHDEFIEFGCGKSYSGTVNAAIEAAHEYRERYKADSSLVFCRVMAEHMYDIAVKREKHHRKKAQIEFEAGAWHYDTGLYHKAREAFSSCEKFDSSIKRLHYKKAEVSFADGKYEDALTDIQRHLQMQPDDPKAELLLREIQRKIKIPEIKTSGPSVIKKKSRRTRSKTELAPST